MTIVETTVELVQTSRCTFSSLSEAIMTFGSPGLELAGQAGCEQEGHGSLKA
jgi:hypothetical protein